MSIPTSSGTFQVGCLSWDDTMGTHISLAVPKEKVSLINFEHTGVLVDGELVPFVYVDGKERSSWGDNSDWLIGELVNRGLARKMKMKFNNAHHVHCLISVGTNSYVCSNMLYVAPQEWSIRK